MTRRNIARRTHGRSATTSFRFSSSTNWAGNQHVDKTQNSAKNAENGDEAVTPRSAGALIALCLDSETSMQAIAEEAGQNTALANIFFRAAEQQGAAQRRVSQAVLSIGLDEACKLALVYAVQSAMPDALTVEEQEMVLVRAMRRASTAEQIAEDARETETRSAFAGGLMADMGLIFAMDKYPHLKNALFNLSHQPSAKRVSAERMIVGVDHGSAFAQSPIAEHVPQNILEAIQQHHSDVDSTLARIIEAADHVEDMMSAPNPAQWMTETAQRIAVAGGRTSVAPLLDSAIARTMNMATALQLTVDHQRDAQELFAPCTLKVDNNVGEVLSINRNTIPSSESMLNQMSNRKWMERQINTCDQNGDEYTVLYFNFNQFKDINNSYGVPAGDRILQQVVGALRSCLNSPADQMARIGGDTFAVLLPHTGQRLGQVTAERIRSMVERNPVKIGANTRVSCSVSVFGTTARTSSAASLTNLEESANTSSTRNRLVWM